MANVQEGGCQCGFVRYRIADCPTVVSICHCRDCQRQSGSAFGMSLALANGAFEFLSGELASFEVTADSGRVKICAFCPKCGTRILPLRDLDEPEGRHARRSHPPCARRPLVDLPQAGLGDDPARGEAGR